LFPRLAPAASHFGACLLGLRARTGRREIGSDYLMNQALSIRLAKNGFINRYRAGDTATVK
jgi:hypothetical protein